MTKFSDREQQILKVLGQKKMTIRQITTKLFRKKRPDASTAVAGAIRRINIKCETHDLPWYLNGVGLGRAGKTVWKEKR